MGLLIVIGVIVLLIVIFKFFRENPGIFIGGGILLGIIAGIVAFFVNGVKNGAGPYMVIALAAVVVLIVFVKLMRKQKNDRFLNAYYHGSMTNPTDIVWFLDSGMQGVDEADKPQVRRLLCEHGWKKLHEPRLGTDYAMCLLEGNAEDRATACNVAREVADTGYIPAMAAVVKICWKADFYDFDLEYVLKLLELEKEHPADVVPILNELHILSNSEDSIEEYCRVRNALYCTQCIHENGHVVGKEYNRLDPKSVIDADLTFLENGAPVMELYAKVYRLIGENGSLHSGQGYLNKFGEKINLLTFDEYSRMARSGDSELNGAGDLFLRHFSDWSWRVSSLDQRRKNSPDDFSVMFKKRLNALLKVRDGLEETEKAVLRDAEKYINEVKEAVFSLLAEGYESSLDGAMKKQKPNSDGTREERPMEGEKKFKPIDLTEENVQKLYEAVKLDTTDSDDSYFENLVFGDKNSLACYFNLSKTKLRGEEKSIRYLLGQLAVVHEKYDPEKAFDLEEITRKYSNSNGESILWTTRTRPVITLLTMASFFGVTYHILTYQGVTKTGLATDKITPTLSPKDRKYFPWWKEHRTEWGLRPISEEVDLDADELYALGKECLAPKRVPGERRPVYDFDNAAKYFAKAAAMGHLDAQVELAACYQKGRGVPEDPQKAYELFFDGAMKKHPESQYRVGRCLYDGTGVEQDQAAGIRWYYISAAQGCSSPKMGLKLAECPERHPVEVLLQFYDDFSDQAKQEIRNALVHDALNADYSEFTAEEANDLKKKLQEACNGYLNFLKALNTEISSDGEASLIAVELESAFHEQLTAQERMEFEAISNPRERAKTIYRIVDKGFLKHIYGATYNKGLRTI